MAKSFTVAIQWKAFSLIFQTLCISVTLLLAILCYCEFLRNEDAVEVSYKKLYEEYDNFHPSLTICFTSPFDDEKLQWYQGNLSSTSYEEYTLGNRMANDRLNNISYDNVSIDLIKFIQYVTHATNDEHYHINRNTSSLINKLCILSWGLKSTKMVKCLSLHVPYKKGIKINTVGIGLKSTIFPNNIRPVYGWNDPFGMHVYFHKKGQFIRSFASRKYIWPKRSTNKSLQINAYISGIEVLKRRHKPEYPCRDELVYDAWILNHLTRFIGCKPPYWEQIRGVPVCQTQEDLRDIASVFWETFHWNPDSNPPCTEIRRLQVKFDEFEEFDDYRGQMITGNVIKEKDTIEINMQFGDLSFTEIKQSQAYDTKKLIGDIGGYIGLLLGYALLGMPGFMHRMYHLGRKAMRTNTECSVKKVSSKIQAQELPELTTVEQNENVKDKI